MADSPSRYRDDSGTASWMRNPLVHLQALVVLAVLLGGGGVAYGINNLVIGLLALLLLGIHGNLAADFALRAPLSLRLLLLATLALPLIQLIPLPPAVWQSLPGREPVLAAHTVAGLGSERWFPWSVDRARTLVAFAGLIAPASILVLGTMLPEHDKRRLAATLVVVAVLALLLGAVQLQSGNTRGLLYPVHAGSNILYATFANRNSAGLLFVIAATLAVALADPGKPRTLLVTCAGTVLLALAAILTQSRSSMALLVVPAFLAALRVGVFLLRHRQSAAASARAAILAVALMGMAGAGVIVWSASTGGRVAQSLARFEDQRTDRPEVWEDTLYAARQYWPLGSGAGTFDEVFQIHESLEHVSPRKAGRAHNDWLEIMLESGLAGLVLALAWLVWAARAGWRALAYGPHWMASAGALGLAAIALQSLIDYPLRNQTLLCLAALLAVLLAQGRKGTKP